VTELNPSIRDIPMPKSIAALPIGPNGYPCPWFIAWIDGKPEFRAADSAKLRMAVRQKLCWVCGQKLNNRVTFVVGSMCVVNRTSAEPPSHFECAEYSAKACPFLSRPHMDRREGGIVGEVRPPGEMIRRNPGVTCLWTAKSPGFEPFSDGKGGTLFYLFPATTALWFAEGRLATAGEVRASVESGLPILRAMAEAEGLPAIMELNRMVAEAERYFPAP
jgi:hypothetical protein